MKESNTNKENSVEQSKIFTPKNDIVFKLLFGSKRKRKNIKRLFGGYIRNRN